MRKVMVAIIAILWIAVGIQYIMARNTGDETQIVEAFSQTSFDDTESVVTGYGVHQGEYQDRESAKQMLSKIANELGIKDDYEWDETREESSGEVILTKQAKHADTKMRFITYEEKQENNVVTATQYIVVQLTLYESSESAMGYKELISEILDDYNFSSQYTVSLKGEYEGELTLDEKNIITDNLLENINANVVSERRSGDIYTIYAYTNSIDEYKTVTKEKINVSLAINYDENEGKSYLYVSTPLIQDDF